MLSIGKNAIFLFNVGKLELTVAFGETSSNVLFDLNAGNNFIASRSIELENPSIPTCAILNPENISTINPFVNLGSPLGVVNFV